MFYYLRTCRVAQGGFCTTDHEFFPLFFCCVRPGKKPDPLWECYSSTHLESVVLHIGSSPCAFFAHPNEFAELCTACKGSLLMYSKLGGVCMISSALHFRKASRPIRLKFLVSFAALKSSRSYPAEICWEINPFNPCPKETTFWNDPMRVSRIILCPFQINRSQGATLLEGSLHIQHRENHLLTVLADSVSARIFTENTDPLDIFLQTRPFPGVTARGFLDYY